jgi:hypothetical protein
MACKTAKIFVAIYLLYFRDGLTIYRTVQSYNTTWDTEQGSFSIMGDGICCYLCYTCGTPMVGGLFSSILAPQI